MAACCASNCAAAEPASSDLPTEWLQAWRNPRVEFRPLQIVHGVPAKQATAEAMRSLKDLGLGGIVCNVAFDSYLRSEANWQTLVEAVKACAEVGLRVWIYDEDGYPSGAAGGLVLKENRDFEALALAYHPSRADPFIIRASYEYTHASNNFYAARRYPNLMDQAAVASFIRATHDAYYQRLEPFFGKTIEAFFTDEPRLFDYLTVQQHLAFTARKLAHTKEALSEALQRNKSWSDTDVPKDVQEALAGLPGEP